MSRTYFACHEVKFRHEIIVAKSRRPKITLHRNRAFVACFNCKFTIWQGPLQTWLFLILNIQFAHVKSIALKIVLAVKSPYALAM